MDNTNAVKAVEDFLLAFTSILYEALPYIILGAVIAGILEELLPQRLITRFLPRNRTLAIFIGALLGLVFPMCECGIIPVMRRLLRKQLPLSCCVAYVLAGPIINWIVLIGTFNAFSGSKGGLDVSAGSSYQMGSWWMTGMRAGLGFVVAVVTAHIVDWQYRKRGTSLLKPLAIPSELPSAEEKEDGPADTRSAWQRLSNISDTALHDFIDITVFLIIGALLAASTDLFIDKDKIADLSSKHAMLSIAVMMLMAVVMSLCSEADAFVAASYTTLRPASKLAFLVLGPMLDIKLYMMYTRVFRPRLMYTIFLSVIVQVFVLSYVTHVLWENYAPRLMAPATAPASQSSTVAR